MEMSQCRLRLVSRPPVTQVRNHGNCGVGLVGLSLVACAPGTVHFKIVVGQRQLCGGTGCRGFLSSGVSAQAGNGAGKIHSRCQ